MNLKNIIIFFLLNLFVIIIDGYRILGVFPSRPRSHHMMFDAICKELANRGHQVDVMTMYPNKNTPNNYNLIANFSSYDESIVNKFTISFASKIDQIVIQRIGEVSGNKICEYLGHPEIQKIVKNPPTDPPYDLVILESFGANCFIGLGHVLKVPVVMASSTINLPWLDNALGQPSNTAIFPTAFTTNIHPMSLLTRILNTLKYHVYLFQYEKLTKNIQNSQMKKYLDPNIPPLEELEKNVVLGLVNSHYSVNGIRPLTPAIIEVGGLHVDSNYVPLSNELEKWLNESTAGVVYFTLGSMVNIETFEENIIKSFYSAFKKIYPVRVSMKIANKDQLLPGLPDNIKISSWIPQVAVLAHKNTKAFITHGGLMGTQEALTYGIPLIGIPLFGDQPANIIFYSKLNMALQLNINNLTDNSISYALNEILNNPKYKKAAVYQSSRFLDRPMSSLDTAIYWIEYAARNGPNSLRSPAVDMSWWQINLLDIYLFIIILFLIIIFIIIFLLNMTLRILLSKRKHNDKND